MLTQGSTLIETILVGGWYVKTVASRLVDDRNHPDSGSQCWPHIEMIWETFLKLWLRIKQH